MVNTLANQNYNYKPSSKVFYGYYDKGTRIGKLLIKKTDISSNINYSSAKNFLYVIVQKKEPKGIKNQQVLIFMEEEQLYQEISKVPGLHQLDLITMEEKEEIILLMLDLINQMMSTIATIIA